MKSFAIFFMGVFGILSIGLLGIAGVFAIAAINPGVMGVLMAMIWIVLSFMGMAYWGRFALWLDTGVW